MTEVEEGSSESSDTNSQNDAETWMSTYRDSNGYLTFTVPTGDGGHATFRCHQVNALMDSSVEEVFGDGAIVHHVIPVDRKNRVSIDIPDAVECVDRGEHARIHAEGYDHAQMARDVDEVILLSRGEDDESDGGDVPESGE